MKSSILILLALMTLTSCSQESKNIKMSGSNLASQIEYADKVKNKVVFEGEKYKMILFAMRSDQLLKPHTSPVDAPLLMIEGSAKVTIGNKEQIVVAGDMITLPKNILHGVYPQTDCKFLLSK